MYVISPAAGADDVNDQPVGAPAEALGVLGAEDAF